MNDLSHDQPIRAIDGATLVADLEVAHPDLAGLLFVGLVAIADRIRAAEADGVAASAIIDPRSRATRTSVRINVGSIRPRTGLPAAPLFVPVDLPGGTTVRAVTASGLDALGLPDLADQARSEARARLAAKGILPRDHRGDEYDHLRDSADGR